MKVNMSYRKRSWSSAMMMVCVQVKPKTIGMTWRPQKNSGRSCKSWHPNTIYISKERMIARRHSNTTVKIYPKTS